MTCLGDGNDHLENTVIKFSIEAQSQEEKGIQKYGQPLNPLDNYDWLKMAIEEQVDGFKYLYAEQVKRAHVVSEIRQLTDNKQIHKLLDQLEGKTCHLVTCRMQR